VIDVIGGRAGDGLDRFLDNTDAFAAGVSSTVTGGLSDKVRAGIYGDITDQSDNGWYTAGQVVGIAPAFATGLATGGTGALAIASKAFATLDTAHGFYESGSKFANGEPLHWTDYASFLPLGGALTSKFASRFNGAVAAEKFAGGTRVASGLMGEFLPPTTIRTIVKGEKVQDLISELAQATYESNGLEHAIVVLRDGTRAIVRGGSGGIIFGDDVRRIILHTHPSTTGPSPEDFEMLDILMQRHSYIYELFGGGLTRFSK
jgi:hypothetical protein